MFVWEDSTDLTHVIGHITGERARFQLFGDTVNTAARMESTGIRNKIQVSQSTYEQLVKDGKANWLKPRSEEVSAKGKGTMRTYWLDPRAKKGNSVGSSGSILSGDAPEVKDLTSSVSELRSFKSSPKALAKQERLIDWMTDMLHEHIRKHVAFRKTKEVVTQVHYHKPEPGKNSLDEVAEVISLPRFCEKTFSEADDYRLVQVDSLVLTEMRQYVATIASHYQ